MMSSAFNRVSWGWQTFIRTKNPLGHADICPVTEFFSGERTGRVGVIALTVLETV